MRAGISAVFRMDHVLAKWIEGRPKPHGQARLLCVHPFVRLMHRYIEDYCNHHDTSVCLEIMDPDYVVHIAGRSHVGRDDRYVPAASAAFANFPDLHLVVHELHTNGDRLVMRFTERGRNRETGRVAAWGGIGLYDWNGVALTSNWVEQDYESRRRQVEGETGPDPVDAVPVDPWSVEVLAAEPSALDVAERWLRAGDWFDAASVVIDDSWITGHADLPLEVASVEIDDIFSVGSTVAAHVGLNDSRGRRLNASAIVRVDGSQVVAIRAVTDRLAFASR